MKCKTPPQVRETTLIVLTLFYKFEAVKYLYNPRRK